MACPYFEPEQLCSGPKPARTPLGQLFDGICHAGEQPVRVEDSALTRDCCNFGYGRGRCPHFPSQAEHDAVRFTRLGSKWIYILERDYSPCEFGEAEGAVPLSVQRQRAAVLDGAFGVRKAFA